MRRALITLFNLIFLLAALAAPAQATIPPYVDDALDQYRREPPLTQRDIDAFVRMWPELASYGEYLTEEDAEDIFSRNGFSQMRGPYVVIKISVAHVIIEATENTGDKNVALAFLEAINTPDVFIPNDAEVRLVERNLDRIRTLPGIFAED